MLVVVRAEGLGIGPRKSEPPGRCPYAKTPRPWPDKHHPRPNPEALCTKPDKLSIASDRGRDQNLFAEHVGHSGDCGLTVRRVEIIRAADEIGLALRDVRQPRVKDLTVIGGIDRQLSSTVAAASEQRRCRIPSI